MKPYAILSVLCLTISSCTNNPENTQSETNQRTEDSLSQIVISREQYRQQLYGFWLGECIANWTGLVTEMDKIGNVGELKTGAFYTRADWGQPDQPSVFSDGQPSDISPTIDFVFRDERELWGADDDTDIEYMYQHLLATHQTTRLTPEQIRTGWLTHIKSEEENYLWVSNQRAFDLMKEGVLPPETSDPAQNEHYDMIDAQLTTEIFVDGRTAAPDGTSKWITSAGARADGHRLRAESDAILVGAGTVRADDPSLTVRDWQAPEGTPPARDPRRVVLGSVDASARIHPCLSWDGPLDDLLERLGAEGVVQLMVEGGARVIGDFHRAGLVDRFVLYQAPVLFGGDDARGLFAGHGVPTIDAVRRGEIISVERFGPDLRIEFRPTS